MLFQIKHVAKSISLANLLKMAVFKMAARKNAERSKTDISITQFLIIIEKQKSPLYICFLGWQIR